jgi:iron complex outermembrane recepter protein
MAPAINLVPLTMSTRHRPTSLGLLSRCVGLSWLGSMAGTQVAAQAVEDASQTVVVTGSLRAQRVLDAPYAIGVVNAKELRDAGPMVNLSEALVRVPGLTVSNRNNYAQDLQISSRGFGARAGFGVRGLRLYTDNIPATMPDGQGQVAHFDLAGAQRIEVLRGPFSVLYGNSSGGVIALFGAPAAEREAEGALDGGSFGMRQQRVSLALPMGEGFDLRVSGSNFDIEGFRPHSAAERQLGNLRLGWRGTADTVTFLLSDHAQKAQDPLGLTRAQFEADPESTTPQATQFDTRKTIRQTQGGINWSHRFAEESALQETVVTAYLGARGVTQWLAIPPITQANPRHGGGVIDFDRDYDGVDARALLRLGTADVVFGISQERQADDRQGYENFIGIPPNQTLGVTGTLRRDEDNRATTRDAYLQAEQPLSDAWALIGGVRSGQMKVQVTDHYLSNGDDSGSLKYSYTNPVLGVRWRAAPNWTLHASAARGFESPTLGELAYRPDGTSGFNTGLKGQTSSQVEVGSKWRADALVVDAALFLIDTDDEIGVATNAGGRSSFQNVGRTRRYGAEGAVAYRFSSAWRMAANLSLLHAEYRDTFLTCSGVPCLVPDTPVSAGNRIAGTQRVIGAAEVGWRPGLVPGEFALEVRGQGSTPVNDTNTDAGAGFALFNLRWSADWVVTASGTLQTLLRVDNLADRHVVGSVIVNDANGRYFEPAAPRSVLLSLRWLQKF